MPGVTTAYQNGIHSARPAASAGCILYACSTHSLIYRSDGSAWSTWMTIGTSTTSMATDALWDAAGDLAVGTGADTGAKLSLTAPAANILNVLGVANGETTPTWKAIHDGTAPVTQAFGDAAAAGTSLLAAHRDHKHGMPASPFATTAHAECSADVTLSSINTLTDSTGCSISLVTGTWDIIAIITFLNGGTAGYIYAEIRDGSNADVSSARANLIAGGYGTLPLMARVTPGSTTTYKLSGQSGVATDKILRYANGTVIGTMLTATRVA